MSAPAPNDKDGHQKWLKWVARRNTKQIVDICREFLADQKKMNKPLTEPHHLDALLAGAKREAIHRSRAVSPGLYKTSFNSSRS